jgi:ADP-ribosylglycohydrolase
MKSAQVSHNSQEGLASAQAVAAAIYLARTGASKADIKKYIMEQFGYDLTKRLATIRRTYTFQVEAAKTVPPAIISFLEADNFEQAIRNAISLGGDSDTLAAISGSLAEAHWKTIDDKVIDHVLSLLPNPLRKVVINFEKQYGVLPRFRKG